VTGPWISSEATASIVPAFTVALGQLVDITRSRTADAGKYSYSYADLAAVLEVVRPTLAGHGLAVTQSATATAGAVSVVTTIVHASGEWLTFPSLELPVAGHDPQALGSGITYARRYSLLAVLGIATEDDDGAHASRARRTADRDEPPPIDWQALGWTDQAAHDAERERVRAQLGALDPDVRASLREAWEDRGHRWPISRDELAAWDTHVAGVLEQAAEPDPEPVPSEPPPRPKTGPRSPAGPNVLAALRDIAAQAELDEHELVEYSSTVLGGAVISVLEDLTTAQARAVHEALVGSLTRPAGPPDQ
jgi:hypothetical protein